MMSKAIATTSQSDQQQSLRLQLWDIAGQARFRNPSYLRDATVAMIVYDVSHRDSFVHVADWLQQVREIAVAGSSKHNLPVIICLVGNKTDVPLYQRQVSTEEARQYAQTEGLMFWECSAKAGYNIQRLFRTLLAVAVTRPVLL